MIFTISIVCLSVGLLITGLFVANLFVYRRLPPLGKLPAGETNAVSVLIPARNEERNISQAVQSVLDQSAPGQAFEVLVLDDQSTDRTAQIVEATAARDPRVRLVRGSALPEGWCGKMHACHQLSQNARFPLLLFMDADVRLEKGALARLAAAGGTIPFLSGVPRQITGTWGERLLIPLIHFILLGFLPMHFARRSRWSAFAAGCGQLVLVNADAYRATGGHAAIRDSMHDGLKLPRAFRRAGFHTGVFDATDVACCRLYQSGAETWQGLSKNAVEGLAAPGTILPMTTLLVAGQILPWLVIGIAVALGQWTAAAIASVATLTSLVPRLIGCALFSQNSPFWHPVGVAVLLMIQWQALARHLMGRRSVWKGREYSVPASRVQSTSAPSPMPQSSTAPKAPGRAPQPVHAVARLMLLLVTFAMSVNAAPVKLPTLRLTDQFNRPVTYDFRTNNLTLLTVADRKGFEEIHAWVRAARKIGGESISIQGIAQVAGVPSAVRPLVRKQLKNVSRPIMMDWNGTTTATLPLRKDMANVFLVNNKGEVLLDLHGPATAEALEELKAALDKPGN